MGTWTNRDINRYLNKRDLVVIDPLNEKSFSQCITPVGIDLRIGHIISLENPNAIILDADCEHIIIPAHSLNLVVTRELVGLSGNVSGTLHSRGTLAAKGLFTNSTNVDPNWSGGQMIMSVLNASAIDLQIGRYERFITLIVHDTTSYTADGPGNQITSRVLDDLNILYPNADITAIDTYMRQSAQGAQHDLFQALLRKAKHRRLGVRIRERLSTYFLTHVRTGKLFKVLASTFLTMCLLGLVVTSILSFFGLLTISENSLTVQLVLVGAISALLLIRYTDPRKGRSR